MARGVQTGSLRSSAEFSPVRNRPISFERSNMLTHKRRKTPILESHLCAVFVGASRNDVQMLNDNRPRGLPRSARTLFKFKISIPA